MATTVRILNPQNRQGTITADRVVPTSVTAIRFVGIIPSAAMRNTANRATLRCDVSPDGTFDQANTVNLINKGWEGGEHVVKWSGQVVPNEFEVGFGPLDPYWGWTVRATLNLPQTLNFGADLILNPDPVTR